MTSQLGAPALTSRLWDAVVTAAVVILLFGSLLQPPEMALSPGVFAIPVVLMAVVGAYLRRPLYIPRSWLFAFALVAFVAVYGYLHPPDTAYGVDKLRRFVTLTFFTMVAASAIWSRRRSMYLWTFWVALGLVLAVVTVATPAAANGRVSAFDSNPVWIARAFSSSIVIVVWMMATKRLKVWLGLVATAALVVGLFASGSRGPLIAAFVGSLVVLVVGAPSGRLSARAMLMIFTVPILALVLPMIPAFTQSRIGMLITGESAGGIRREFWSASLDVIATNPFGVGIGDWAPATGFSDHLWPHNMALEVTAEFGWFAGIALVLFVFLTGVRLYRRYRSHRIGQVLLALLVTESLHVSTSGDLNARTFFFVLILAAAFVWSDESVTGVAAADEDSKWTSGQLESAPAPAAGR